MSFNIALSGIAASQKDLNATANNIANVNTVGFKESRAEFGDVYANLIFSKAGTAVGSGVNTVQVAQQFNQGSLQFTNNPLDMAITGGGFFVVSADRINPDYSYTRAGAFKIDTNNFLVDTAGNFLQTFPVDEEGNSTSLSLSTAKAVQIPETVGSPRQTEEVGIQINLNAGETAKVLADFDPDNPDTFNNSTSLTFYDSLGERHVLTSYFVRPENAAYTGQSNWVAFYAVDGNPVNVAGAGGSFQTDTDGDGTPETNNTANVGGWTGAVMRYNDTGTFIGSDPAVITTEELGVNGAGALEAGADDTQTLTINFNSPTQYASSFEVIGLTQDGASVGRLINVQVGSDGLITASYSNGSSVPWARMAMARFTNEQGLIQVGNTSWKESLASGPAQSGEAGSGSFGDIRSSALEQSNVDLTTELVDLISAQRNFQANSRTLEVNNTLQQTILQIR